MPRGVVPVCPRMWLDEYSDAAAFHDLLRELPVVPFPEGHRPFKEVIVFAHKRARHERTRRTPLWESVEAPQDFVYHIPTGAGPRVFLKVEPTEPSCGRCWPLALGGTLDRAGSCRLPSPPLASASACALLLASGHLDGVVQPEGRLPML